MKKELDGIKSMGVWTGCHVLPEGKRALSTVWVYRLKFDPDKDGLIFKARLCVQGFRKLEFFDYGETYAPTGQITTL